MIYYLMLASMPISVATGVLAIAIGDWRKFKLKYAGVVLSTATSIGILLALASSGQVMSCDAGAVCATWYFYHLLRNVAFTLFHISTSRDAVRFKNRNRRECDKKVKRGDNDRYRQAA